MKVINLKELSKEDYERIVNRSAGKSRDIFPAVRKIMDSVKENGDVFLIDEFKKRFGGENYKSLSVSREEIDQAYNQVNDRFVAVIKQMIKNITAVHQAQLPEKKDAIVYPEKGIYVTRVWRAIEKVGLYVPGGNAIYPSSVLMSAIPAQIAGCKEIVMCSPARGTGEIPAPTCPNGLPRSANPAY